MNQQKYTNDILKEFECLNSKSSIIPMEHHHDLLQEYDNPLLQDVTSYIRLIEKFIHLTIS